MCWDPQKIHIWKFAIHILAVMLKKSLQSSKLKTIQKNKSNFEVKSNFNCTWANTQKIFITFIAKSADSFLCTICFPTSRKILFYEKRSCVTNNLASLVQEPKVTLQSDQVFLPKISENSVPVYESVGDFGPTLRTINKIAIGLPVLALGTAVMPWLSFTAIALHYFIYFKVNRML